MKGTRSSVSLYIYCIIRQVPNRCNKSDKELPAHSCIHEYIYTDRQKHHQSYGCNIVSDRIGDLMAPLLLYCMSSLCIYRLKDK